MTKYEMQIQIERKGETVWLSVSPGGRTEPYRYATLEEASKMLRVCYPDLCRERRLGISDRVRIMPVDVGEGGNQCDGCARGLPLKGGNHYQDGHPVQGCTAHLYVTGKESTCTEPSST